MTDDFDDIINGLDFDITEPADIVNVSIMHTVDLTLLIDRLEKELLEIGELLWPRTQEGRDKHSLRNAAQVELASRKNST